MVRSRSLAPIIGQLVAWIETAWRRVGYAHADFARISSDALSAVAPFAHVDPVEALAALALGEARDTLVGEHRSPQVVPLYSGPRFALTLHAWQNHLQTAHSHAWCGAYQVLLGTSVHGLYRFEEDARYDGKLLLGALTQYELELLEPGAIVPVHRGERSMIHGVCYLEPLGISLCTRTKDNDPALTHDFVAPGLGVQGSHVERSTLERLCALDALVATRPARASQVLDDWLAVADPRTCFYVLRHAALRLRSDLDVDRALARAAPRFGRHADAVVRGVEAFEREALLRARRNAVTAPDHRLLFAALYMARDLAEVERIVATRCAEPPRAFIGRCLLEMASTEGAPGWSLLGTPISSDFGPVLVALLDDPRTDAVLARLADDYDEADIRAMESELRDACATLRGLATLRPLFAPREARS